MRAADRIDELRQEIPGCTAVVIGDIGTGIVLRASADSGLRQEAHDALLAEAMACHAGSTPNWRRALPGAPRPLRAVRMDAEGYRLFQGTGDGSGTVVCARGTEPAALDLLATALNDLLNGDDG